MKPIVRSFLLTGLLSAALMVLVACNSAITETDATSPDSGEVGDAGTQADTDAAQISSSLPADFPVIVYQGAGLSQGDQVMFSELVAQGKPVVLNFWAGLCPPCRLEMPDLQAASDEYADQVLMIGLDVGPFTALGSYQDGQRLIDDLQINYMIGTTSEPTILRHYEVRGMPSTYFILPDGELFRAWTGILTHEKLTELIDDMLAASGES